MRYACLLMALLGLLPGPALGANPNPPQACKLLTPDDVAATLGPGFALGPAAALLAKSEMSGCLYQKGASNSVAVAILAAPESNAKAGVLARQARYQQAGLAVTPLPGLCDAAFTVVISPTNMTLVAGKGPWYVEFQVSTAGKPDATAEQKLAKVVCSRMP